MKRGFVGTAQHRHDGRGRQQGVEAGALQPADELLRVAVQLLNAARAPSSMTLKASLAAAAWAGGSAAEKI